MWCLCGLPALLLVGVWASASSGLLGGYQCCREPSPTCLLVPGCRSSYEARVGSGRARGSRADGLLPWWSCFALHPQALLTLGVLAFVLASWVGGCRCHCGGCEVVAAFPRFCTCKDRLVVLLCEVFRPFARLSAGLAAFPSWIYRDRLCVYTSLVWCPWSPGAASAHLQILRALSP